MGIDVFATELEVVVLTMAGVEEGTGVTGHSELLGDVMGVSAGRGDVVEEDVEGGVVLLVLSLDEEVGMGVVLDVDVCMGGVLDVDVCMGGVLDVDGMGVVLNAVFSTVLLDDVFFAKQGPPAGPW